MLHLKLAGRQLARLIRSILAIVVVDRAMFAKRPRRRTEGRVRGEAEKTAPNFLELLVLRRDRRRLDLVGRRDPAAATAMHRTVKSAGARRAR